MCTALLLGAASPAGATEEASVEDAFVVADGYLQHSSCAGEGLEFVAQFVGMPQSPRGGHVRICSELGSYDVGTNSPCWKGINGWGQLDDGAGELYDLVDVTIERVYAHAAGQVDGVNPYPQDTAWWTSQVPHFLVEGSYVRGSDQSQGRLRIIVPVAGLNEYNCTDEYHGVHHGGYAVLQGGSVPAA